VRPCNKTKPPNMNELYPAKEDACSLMFLNNSTKTLIASTALFHTKLQTVARFNVTHITYKTCNNHVCACETHQNTCPIAYQQKDPCPVDKDSSDRNLVSAKEQTSQPEKLSSQYCTKATALRVFNLNGPC
jgi:hypothetical protein